MLWARAVSDGVRALCPEVNTGTYTPEEIADFEELPQRTMQESPAVVATETPVEDAEFTKAPTIELASGAQITRMTELFKELEIGPEKQLNWFKMTGAYDLGSLTAGGADVIIGKMEARLNGAKIADQIVAAKSEAAVVAEQAPQPPALPESATSADDGSPATGSQIELIKTLLESASQKPGQSGIAARIKEHLNMSGIYKMGQMSELSAQRLIESLNGTSEIDSFFDVAPRSANTGE